MGRTPSYDRDQVVAAAAALFRRRGFEATSIDDLVTGLGVHRGSLYKAFGSKRGLFLAALDACVDSELPAALAAVPPGRPDLILDAAADQLDLLLVAAVEQATADPTTAERLERAVHVLASHLGPRGDPTAEARAVAIGLLGARLATRFSPQLGRTAVDHLLLPR